MQMENITGSPPRITLTIYRVIMFKIPAAIGIPTTWKKIAYDRVGESLDVLNDVERDTILSTVNVDLSRQIISGLTVEDLDREAIRKARKQFKLKNENLNKKEQKIKNIGTTRYSVWILK